MIRLHDKLFTPYIKAAEIEQINRQLADQLITDFADKNPIFIVILNGAATFACDLVRLFPFPCEMSFIKVRSYAGTESTGVVSELIGLDVAISGRVVVLLEDIIETGSTIKHLLAILRTHDPAELRVATLLLKPDIFKKIFTVDYVGKSISNDFVVGYGLDYDGLGRNYPDIYTLVSQS